MMHGMKSKLLKKNFHMFEFTAFSLLLSYFKHGSANTTIYLHIYSRHNRCELLKPLFAYILVAAEALYCIRIPYNSVVLAAGHYRQTRNGALPRLLLT
jgi:hypothetical protein